MKAEWTQTIAQGTAEAQAEMRAAAQERTETKDMLVNFGAQVTKRNASYRDVGKSQVETKYFNISDDADEEVAKRRDNKKTLEQNPGSRNAENNITHINQTNQTKTVSGQSPEIRGRWQRANPLEYVGYH